MDIPDDIPQASKDCLANTRCGGCVGGYLACQTFLAGRLEHLRRKHAKLQISLVDRSKLTAAQLAYKEQESIDIPLAIERVTAALAGGRGYGTCETCRKPLVKERLEHFPEARRCVPCQQRADRI